MIVKKDGTKHVFLYDAEDATFVAERHWMVVNGYAVAWVYVDGIRRLQGLHRLLMGLTYGDENFVDHINGRRNDNQRCNLRVTDPRGNGLNRAAVNNLGSSRHRGVSWSAQRKRWYAQVQLDGKCYNLGRHLLEEDAVAAVTAFRKAHGLPSY